MTDVLNTLRKQSILENEKEELRKKYENYKKLFINEKQERELKAKELQILKEKLEGPIPEVKELRVKYENYRIQHTKEYNLRKEKEGKLEAAHSEIQKLKVSLDDIYT